MGHEKNNSQVFRPELHDSVFIAEGARIYGNVVIAEGASIWFNAVLRGDEGRIEIGRDTNVQDNVVIHSDMDAGVSISERVTLGHGSVIRGCRICEDVMVGMNATIMSHAEIGAQSIVGANSFIPYHKTFPPGSLIMGSPAKAVRGLTDEELGFNRVAIDIYKNLVKRYRSGEIVGLSGAIPAGK
ncbi:MAG: gamma carbonic anhydrase family protein [Desulfobacterales bacterium]|nr:gamma carbonic anhydrase family protein [Desulfobacterales bacterium]